jgi:hypothetical protein
MERLERVGGAAFGERAEHDDRQPRIDLRISFSVWMPSISGISTSSVTRSGLSCAIFYSAIRPFAASPMTSIIGSAASIGHHSPGSTSRRRRRELWLFAGPVAPRPP